MIYGYLNASPSHDFLEKSEAWRTAFNWLKQLPPDLAGGIHPILGDKMYANVHGYETLARPECKFESHQRHVDLQYCITGSELIDWQLTSRLTPAGGFDEPKDLQFYEPVDVQTVVHMTPGAWAIFFPEDAHRPKVTDKLSPRVWKLVIKINRELL